MTVETFGFTAAPTAPAGNVVERRTITDPTEAGQVVIYPHGFSVRVVIDLDKFRTEEALTRCGWSVTPDPKVWKVYAPRRGRRRWVMRGSAWLTGRAPRNRTLALSAANVHWRTRLYTVGIEEEGTGYAIDLQGVRDRDVRKFMEDVLQIAEDKYRVAYFRAAERYVVLHAPDAHVLAGALGGREAPGRGRLARKRFLVRNHAVPITVRRQTQMNAKVNIYRVGNGATSAFKCEIALTGRRSKRQQFHHGDIERLDEVLLRLVHENALLPVHKPSRWEPRQFTTRVERGAFEPNLQRLPQAAWRGASMPKAFRELVAKCHTPGKVIWLENGSTSGTYPAPAYIRSDSPPSSTSSSSKNPKGNDSRWFRDTGKGFDIACWTRAEATPSTTTTTCARSKPDSPWRAIADEVGTLTGFLTEVILDGNQDPMPLVDALTKSTGRHVGISALCPVRAGTPETWYSVREAMLDYPVTDDIDLWVVVIDVGVDQAIMSGLDPVRFARFRLPVQTNGMIDLKLVQMHGFAVTEGDVLAVGGKAVTLASGSVEVEYAAVEAILGRRPKIVPDWWDFRSWGVMPQVARAVAAWSWDMVAELRNACEREGINIVLVTTDVRPQAGRGPLQKSHFFRDTRVRSWIGDAGRYLAHQRYLVEHDEDREWWRVIATKDEAEGLVGRIPFEGPILTVAAKKPPSKRVGLAIVAEVPEVASLTSAADVPLAHSPELGDEVELESRSGLVATESAPNPIGTPPDFRDTNGTLLAAATP